MKFWSKIAKKSGIRIFMEQDQQKNEKQSGKGLGRIIRAFGWSMLGFRAAYCHEAAFRQELFVCLFLIPMGYFWGQGGVEKALLISSLLIILIVELLNSAIEAIVDRVGHEHHYLSGRAKDLGSAAVFMSFVYAFVIWLLVLMF